MYQQRMARASVGPKVITYDLSGGNELGCKGTEPSLRDGGYVKTDKGGDRELGRVLPAPSGDVL